VANLRDETLAFVSLGSGEQRVLHLPGPPHEIVESQGRLYVTLGRGNAVAEVDARSAAILRLLPLDGEPHGIAVFGSNLIVTLDKANAAVVLDRATLTELRRYATGLTPHSVAVSNNAILVTDSTDNALRQLEPEVRTISTGEQPESVALAGPYAVTADAASGSLTIAGAADLSGASRLDVGAAPVRVVALATGQVLAALQRGTRGEVVVVDVLARKVERRIAVSPRPDGLCPSPDSAHFAVSSNAEGTIQVFSTNDWKPVLSLTMQPGLGSCLWVTTG
jgi:DNA-binding beta-propeller fold protein YncE